MKSFRELLRATVFVIGLLAFGLSVQSLTPSVAWSQQSDAAVTLLAFNRAALSGDLDTVERLLSSRFLQSTSFTEQRRLNAGRLIEEVRLMSFYQIVGEERLPGQEVRIKVVQQRLVGGQGFVTRWYYLKREGGLWRVDRIGREMAYR
jgi:hypothetical protein